jgi:flavin-dependent dehydrogenase
MPSSNAIENNSVKYAKIFSPSKSFELNAEKQKVVVLDRRTFDKQVAFQAQKSGAEIRTKCSMHSISKRNNTDNSNSDNSYYIIKTSEGLLTCNYFIDARGIGSLIKHNRQGLLQSAQYEVYAPWIDRNTIEISFDRERYPGFFAWIIPTGSGKGKVGVAGRSINAANSLKSYIEGKGERYSVVRKVYAPIWIMGPLEHFVIDRSMVIGDAAGQTKPTTAGGIYTCGIGGILAGKALTKSIEKNDRNLMYYYEKNWFSIFKSEFDKMLILRKVLERLDNRAIDKIFSTISQGEIDDISKIGDFDFHSTALSRILHSTISLKIAKTIFDNEIRRLINF